MTDTLATSDNKMNSHGLMQKALEIQNRDKLKESKMSNKNEQNDVNAAIVLKDGIFTISENLETSGVKQDPELKSLIDSILK